MRPWDPLTASLVGSVLACLALSPSSLPSGGPTNQPSNNFGARLHAKLADIAKLGVAAYEPHSVLEVTADGGGEAERHLREICQQLLDLPRQNSLTMRREAHAGQTIVALLARASEGAWLPEGCGSDRVAAVARAIVALPAYATAVQKFERLVTVEAPKLLASVPRSDADAYDDWLKGSTHSSLRRDIVASDLSWLTIALAAGLPKNTASAVFADIAREIHALTRLHVALYQLDRSNPSLNALIDGGAHVAALFLTTANVLRDAESPALIELARSAINDISTRFSKHPDNDVRLAALSHIIQLANCQEGLISPALLARWRASLASDHLLESSSPALLSHAARAWDALSRSTDRGVCFLV